MQGQFALRNLILHVNLIQCKQLDKLSDHSGRQEIECRLFGQTFFVLLSFSLGFTSPCCRSAPTIRTGLKCIKKLSKLHQCLIPITTVSLIESDTNTHVLDAIHSVRQCKLLYSMYQPCLQCHFKAICTGNSPLILAKTNGNGFCV